MSEQDLRRALERIRDISKTAVTAKYGQRRDDVLTLSTVLDIATEALNDGAPPKRCAWVDAKGHRCTLPDHEAAQVAAGSRVWHQLSLFTVDEEHAAEVMRGGRL